MGLSPVSRRASTLISIAITPFALNVLLQCFLYLGISLGFGPGFECTGHLCQYRGLEKGFGFQQYAITHINNHQFQTGFLVMGAPKGLGYDHLVFAGEFGGFYGAVLGKTKRWVGPVKSRRSPDPSLHWTALSGDYPSKR